MGRSPCGVRHISGRREDAADSGSRANRAALSARPADRADAGTERGLRRLGTAPCRGAGAGGGHEIAADIRHDAARRNATPTGASPRSSSMSFSSPSTGARAVLDLVRAVPRLRRGLAGTARTFADCLARLPITRRWLSTCCICRRYIPWPGVSQGQEQRAGSRPTRGIPWAIGARRRHKVDTSAARHARRLRAPAHGRRGARHRDRARHRVPGAPDHPYCASIPSGSRGPGRHGAVRGESAEEYQDIYPFNIETPGGAALGRAEGRVRILIAQGERIFRVDNPHTKPFPFWMGRSPS